MKVFLLPGGRKSPEKGCNQKYMDETTAVIYEPMELMERLAALVPPPRFNIVRYYVVLNITGTRDSCRRSRHAVSWY
jgi:hypothetical protein